jgi:prevent-host-death family protein
MNVVNIHQAKTQLSKLVEQAAQGESFIIAKAGKPMVKVVALDAPQTKKPKRLDSLKGQFSIPDDFDRMFEKEIEQMFYGDE